MRLGVKAALVDGRFVPGDVRIADGLVTDVGVMNGAPGRGIAVPGFVDLQVNGFGGVDFMSADRDGYAQAGEAMLATGTTSFQPTFVTSPPDVVTAALREMPLSGIGPRVLGAHLEGPFLSPHRMGVHDRAARRAPDLGLLRRLLDIAPVRQMTLAPELPGAAALIDELRGRKTTVSAGHTDADAAQAHAAFDRGVTTVTHLYNAMRPSSPREPGLAVAALARADVVVQVIADGHHLAAETVAMVWRAAAGRFALVTDAVAAAGRGDGAFMLGSRPVIASGGVVRGPEGQLAGSALTMIGAVRNLHAFVAPLAAALEAASTVPARIAGRPDLGRVAPGAPADLVVLDDRLEVERVYVAGGERVAA